MNQVSLQLKGHSLMITVQCVATDRLKRLGLGDHTDHSLNVVLGVPESRDLLGTEALVSCVFESVVGRKVTITDCRQIGRFSTELARSRPFLVKFASVLDHRLLLSSK